MRLRRRALLAGLLLVMASSLPAAAQPKGPAFDLDVRSPRENASPAPHSAPGAAQRAAIADLRGAADVEPVLSWSRLTGAPSRVTGRGRPLSVPSKAPAHAIADSFLGRYRNLFGLSAQDVREMRQSRDFRSAGNGVSHLTLQQQAHGIDVFGGELRINIDASGRVLNVSGEPIPNLHASVNAIMPGIDPADAIASAALAAGVEQVKDASARDLIYFPVAPGDVRLGWLVAFADAIADVSYESIVDATDGAVLWRKSLTLYNHLPVHGMVFTSDSPIPNTPMGSSTGTVVRQDMPFAGIGVFPHDDVHYDWFAGGPTNQTISNNVVAYLDAAADNTYDVGDETTAGTDGSGNDFFNFPIDFTMEPSTYVDAAVTNLFYWNNRLHNFFYRLGFDEASGNFQSDNFGLGGVDSDPVQAEAQDGQGLCNANMNTGADGNPPRMQMYLCDNVSPMRDGDLEGVVIAHEYTHGVHSRLVPTSGNQRPNEGWADYFGLVMVAEPGDPYDGAYGVGDYLFALAGAGIRSDPYSTDLSIYQRTFADINDATRCAVRTCSSDDTETCSDDSDCANAGDTCDALSCSFHLDCEPPSTSISQGPCRTSEHRTGEMWANALWIARFNLVEKYGFAAGNLRMNRIVIDGMKLTASDPTFLDARDGVLAADQADYNGLHSCLIWNGFAKMGMGFSALTTGVDDINPVEAFDVPAECAPNMQVNTDTSFGLVCGGGTASKPLQIYNTGGGDLIVTSVANVSGSADITVDVVPETPVFIANGSHVDFTVRCTPSGSGLQTATIRIESNDPTTPTRDLVYTCTAGEPDMVVFIADSGAFGEVCVDSFKDLNLTIQNNGTCNLTVSSITSNDAEFVIAAGATPLVVEAGNSVLVPVRYQPTEFGPDNAMVTVTGNDGSRNVAVSGVAPAPDIQVAIANSGDFGSVCKGQHADLDVTLFNQGRCDLTITGLDLLPDAGPFVMPANLVVSEATPLVLSHDADFRFPIRFSPEECFDEAVTRTLRITSDDPDEMTVDVDLSGDSPCPNLVIDPAPVTGIHAFPATVVDTTESLGCFSERPVVLRNSGTCPLTISSITAEGLTNVPDFSVAAPTVFPVLLPPGEETLTVRVRFTPKSDADPLAPGELLGVLDVVSDDPDYAGDATTGQAGLCGESVTQSGVRILVTDISSGTPVPVGNVDSITIQSKGKNTPSPINLQFTNRPVFSTTVCGRTVQWHVNQETLPSTATTGSNPRSSYEAKAKEGNLQAGESFGLGQCELRDFQLQLLASSSPGCLLKKKGESCTSAGECCSGSCKGATGNKTCK